MIDRREITIDIAAQHIGVAVAITFISLDRGVGALASAVSEGIPDKTCFEDRANDGA